MQDQLGHAVVSTTNTYLNAGKHQRQDLMRKTDELRSRCKRGSDRAVSESMRGGMEVT